MGNVRICSQFLTSSSSAANELQVKKLRAIRPEDIPILSKTYSLNSEQVVAEFADFCEAFKTLSHSSEVDTETVTVAEVTDGSSTADSELDENDEPAERSTLHNQKTQHSFYRATVYLVSIIRL
jgi:hypothetical protein